MAQRVRLDEPFEGHPKDAIIIVTNKKLIQMTKDKIKFNTRLKSGTGTREYTFEEKDKEQIITNNKKNK